MSFRLDVESRCKSARYCSPCFYFYIWDVDLFFTSDSFGSRIVRCYLCIWVQTWSSNLIVGWFKSKWKYLSLSVGTNLSVRDPYLDELCEPMFYFLWKALEPCGLGMENKKTMFLIVPKDNKLATTLIRRNTRPRLSASFICLILTLISACDFSLLAIYRSI